MEGIRHPGFTESAANTGSDMRAPIIEHNANGVEVYGSASQMRQHESRESRAESMAEGES